MAAVAADKRKMNQIFEKINGNKCILMISKTQTMTSIYSEILNSV